MGKVSTLFWVIFLQLTFSEHAVITSAAAECITKSDSVTKCGAIKYLGCVGTKKFYYESTTKLNWFEAWEYCRSLGLHLAAIETRYEHKFIHSNIPKLFSKTICAAKYKYNRKFKQYVYGEVKKITAIPVSDATVPGNIWTSGTDLGNEGTFSWMASGRQFAFTRFSPGQPDNAGGIEHCVEFWPQDTENFWNDRPCTVPNYAICQYDSK